MHQNALSMKLVLVAKEAIVCVPLICDKATFVHVVIMVAVVDFYNFLSVAVKDSC